MVDKSDERGEKEGGGEEGKPLKRIDYRRLPPEVEEIVSEERAKIEREASITFDGRQYLVRFPKDISDNMGLSRENKVRFTLTIPKPRTEEEPKLKIEVIKDTI